MAYKGNPNLFQTMLNAAKAAFDGGTIHLYASASVPNSADAALDMAGTHTQLAVFSGVTFETASGDTLVKTASQQWESVISFTGAHASETTLTPTFFRLVAPGGNPAAAGNEPRIQGTVGGPSSAADLTLGSATLTRNGTNTVGIAAFVVRLWNLG